MKKSILFVGLQDVIMNLYLGLNTRRHRVLSNNLGILHQMKFGKLLLQHVILFLNP